MNPRYRLYIIAFAIYTSALLVTAALAWLAIQYDMVAGIAQLAVSITGNGLGGVALVFGILQDDRARKAQEETARAREEAAKAQQQAEQYRERAERAEAELQRLRAEQNGEFADRIRRLEIAAGLAPPDTSDDATEN